jgi:hypothetical protein
MSSSTRMSRDGHRADSVQIKAWVEVGELLCDQIMPPALASRSTWV